MDGVFLASSYKYNSNTSCCCALGPQRCIFSYNTAEVTMKGIQITKTLNVVNVVVCSLGRQSPVMIIILTSGYATSFTAVGAIRIAHYDVIDDVITRKLTNKPTDTTKIMVTWPWTNSILCTDLSQLATLQLAYRSEVFARTDKLIVSNRIINEWNKIPDDMVSCTRIKWTIVYIQEGLKCARGAQKVVYLKSMIQHS